MNSVRQRLLAGVTLAALLVSAGSACRKPAGSGPAPAPGASPSPVGAYDAELTDRARLLGGLLPERKGYAPPLVHQPAWQTWHTEFGEMWTRAASERFRKVRSWEEAELRELAAGCTTLLLPFGGADILSAYLRFPRCDGYVLIGSQPAGDMPAIDDPTPAQFAGLTEGIRRGLAAVFPAGGAVPRRSGPATPPQSVFALLAVQLVRLDARIISVSRFDLAADGRPLEPTPVKDSSVRMPALNIAFEVPGGTPQSLVYFPAELDDAALKRRPGVWTFLRLQAPFLASLEAASPLAGDRFALLRRLILDQSLLILQGDRGIPAPLLGAAEWVVTTHERAPTTTPPGASRLIVAVRKQALRRPKR